MMTKAAPAMSRTGPRRSPVAGAALEHGARAKAAREAGGLRERSFQAEEFLVHRDPEGLKRPGGGVGLASGPSAYGLLDDLSQLDGGVERPALHDASGDAPRLRLLAVAPEQV